MALRWQSEKRLDQSRALGSGGTGWTASQNGQRVVTPALLQDLCACSGYFRPLQR